MSSIAKASSAGSNQRQATGLGRILRGALATRGASSDAAGSGAPSAAHRQPVVLLGLTMALCCLWALAPSPASAKPLYNQIGGAGGTAGGQFAIPCCIGSYLKGPHGPAVNYTGAGAGAQPGDVYVADARNHRIQQFDAVGEFIRAFGRDVIVNSGSPANSNGTGYEVCDTTTEPPNTPAECKAGTTAGTGGAMNEPAAVAIDQDDGSVYVFDVANRRIQKLSSEGAFVWASGKDVLTGGPTAHEVCAVAAECKAGADGTLGGEIAGNNLGSGNAQRGIAVAPGMGSVYFGDLSNRRVQELTPAGAFVRAFGWDVRGISEQQKLNFSEISGGTFELGNLPGSCAEPSTAAIAYSTNNSTLRTNIDNALGAECGGVGNFGVSGTVSGGITVTFEGEFAGVDVPEMTADTTELTGAAPEITIETLVQGVGGTVTTFEECTVAAECKAGISGAGVGQFGAVDAAPGTVAVDSTGAIYTAETDTAGGIGGSGLRVQKFTPQAGPPAFAPSDFAPAILEDASPDAGPRFAPRSVAIDPSTDDVYVAVGVGEGEGTPPASEDEFRVLQLDPSGTEVLDTSMTNLRSILPDSRVQSVNGLAFDPQEGLLYVATSSDTESEERVYVFGDVVPPTVSLDNVVDVTGDGATVIGSVNPNGGLDATYRVEYSLNGRKWFPVGDEVNAGNGEADVPIEHSVTGLPSNSDLSIRIVVTKPFSSARVESGEIQIHTPGVPPAVETGQAWWNGPAELALSGTVNPRNANTRYHFEYGATVAYGQNVPVNLKGPAGDEELDRLVIQQLYDLDTDTAFHYRLVATNEFGTSAGADRVVAAHDESQVYELVSHGESNGLGTEGLMAVSDDGRRVAVRAQTLGDPPSLPSQFNKFIAQLEPDRWSVPSLGPDPSEGSTPAVAQGMTFSADLTSFVIAQRTTIEGQAQEVQWWRGGIDGSLEPASPPLAPVAYAGKLSTNQGSPFELRSASADLSTIVFKKLGSTATYVPGEPLTTPGWAANNEEVNIYRADDPGPDPELGLVNYDPAGEYLSNVCGAFVGALPDLRANIGFGTVVGLGHSARPVSRDGSVIYFSARPSAPSTGSCSLSTPLRVYKRVDDSSTVAVSESQCDREAPDPPCSTTNGNDIFQGASSDGSQVFFTSDRQLADSDLDSPGFFQGCHGFVKTGCDLYLYDADPPAGQPELVQVSAGEATAGHPTVGSGATVQGVVEGSTDGSRIYFVATGQLTDEATQGANNLFVYERSEDHPGGRIEFVTSLSFGDSGLWSEGGSRAAATLPFNGPGGPGEGDGHLFLFRSGASLLAEDEDSAQDLYRYDDEAGELVCISCQGNGEFAVTVPSGSLGSPDHLQASRVASEDGSAAVFATDEAILPEDENTVTDVYVWRGGELRLASGATGEVGITGSPLISPDGTRAFFTTKAALHPADQNSAVDAYAASVGGGLPHPPPQASVCEDGQSCRGDAPPPPPVAAPASAGFVGQGNLTEKAARRARCALSARAARKHSKRAKRLRRAARRANETRKGRDLHRRASRNAKRAKRLRAATKRCRRRAANRANRNQGGQR